MENITSLTAEEYAKILINKYENILKQGISRNFLFFYARKSALEDINNSIIVFKSFHNSPLGHDLHLKFLNETREALLNYKK